MLPTLNSASNRPADQRARCATASAGSPTSTAPITTPASSTVPSSARSPGLASAPARECTCPAAGQPLESADEAKNAVPATVIAAHTITAAAGESATAVEPTSSGPSVQITSCVVASSAYA